MNLERDEARGALDLHAVEAESIMLESESGAGDPGVRHYIFRDAAGNEVARFRAGDVTQGRNPRKFFFKKKQFFKKTIFRALFGVASTLSNVR